MGTVDVVTASAGTGKTHRLVDESVQALDEGVAPERLMAVTFTNRAAAELVERMRTRLLESGRRADAERLLGARIGTVHAVFGDLLREFAFEVGRSPNVEVLSEATAARMFQAAADQAISDHAPLMEELAERFGFASRRKKADWREDVRKVMAAARSNGITPEKLAWSAERSWRTLAVLLPPPHPDGTDALDAALRLAADAALASLRGNGDTTGKTAGVVALLDEAVHILRRHPADLPWKTWAKLTKLAPGRLSVTAVKSVMEAASAHSRHPRLAYDLKAYVDGLFACAAQAAAAYGQWKAGRGVVDFADQEATALELLGDPGVCAALRERIGRLLVDEFQDTSPIQLALFMRMARVVGRSVWVGDPKQVIYGFRDADPELMATVAGHLPSDTGGVTSALTTSWRSRPGLVRFLDDVFVPAFASADLPSGQVALAGAVRADSPGQPCPLGVMPLVAANQAAEAEALAAGILAMVRDCGSWPVQPARGHQVRPLGPGDISVLCRRNEVCSAVAAALERLGMRAAVGRPGLMRSSEVVVAVAALRWASDRTDTLALAELAHLTPEMPTAWLEAALSGDCANLERLVPCVTELDWLRSRLLHLTPGEAMDAAIGAADVVRYAASLGQIEGRLANLEALRGLAREYEQECGTLELPATVGGLIAWLAESKAERPANPDPDAVKVMTCHEAKGMEWSAVVLADLGEPPDARVFDETVAEQDGTTNVDDPLAGRWIRHWPWPYADQRAGVDLFAVGTDSPQGAAAARHAREESVRLLYVAMTRARDYLVLAPRMKKDTYVAGWLDRLETNDGPLLSLPTSSGEPLRVGATGHAVRFLSVASAEGPPREDEAPVFLAAVPGAVPEPPLPLLLRPSTTGEAAGAVGFGITELGARLFLTGNPDMESLGEALHTFIAADRPDDHADTRVRLAESCIQAWGVVGVLLPGDFVEASDRLRRWCQARWPGCGFEHEVPVTGRRGDQRISGRIDLLVRSADGVAIIDHKTFPGGQDRWAARMAEYGPQLAAYAEVCGAAGEAVLAKCIHLPVAGVVLEVA